MSDYYIVLEGNWWTMRAPNGAVSATSEVYASDGNAKKAAKKVGTDLGIQVQDVNSKILVEEAAKKPAPSAPNGGASKVSGGTIKVPADGRSGHANSPYATSRG